jgi:hypothetical protein
MVQNILSQKIHHVIPAVAPPKSPLPLFPKEGLNHYGKNSPFEKGGFRGI